MYIFKKKIRDIKDIKDIIFSQLFDKALKKVSGSNKNITENSFNLNNRKILEKITEILILSVNYVIEKLESIFNNLKLYQVSYYRFTSLDHFEGWHQNNDYLRCNLYLETSGYNFVDFMLNENYTKQFRTETNLNKLLPVNTNEMNTVIWYDQKTHHRAPKFLKQKHFPRSFIAFFIKKGNYKINKKHLLSNKPINYNLNKYPNLSIEPTHYITNNENSNGGSYKKEYIKLQNGGKRLIRIGPKGGKYYMKGGKKYYLK